MTEYPTTSNLATNHALDLAAQVNALHAKIEAAGHEFVEYARQAGELLIAAKQQRDHGGWTQWVGAKCNFTLRTAQTYMKLARETPKIEASKTKRVSYLSIRQAIKSVAEQTRQLAKLPGETQQAVIEYAENDPTCRNIQSAGFKVKRKQQREELARNSEFVIACEFPSSYSEWNYSKIFDAMRQSPEFHDRDQEIERLRAEWDDLARRIDENEKRRKELEGQIRLDIESAVEKQHGWRVMSGEMSVIPDDVPQKEVHTWFAIPVPRETYDHLQQMNKIWSDFRGADKEKEKPLRRREDSRREAFARAVGRCPSCFVRLNQKTSGVPGEPENVYVYCNWCREHRGETHCDGCGDPLIEGHNTLPCLALRGGASRSSVIVRGSLSELGIKKWGA